MAGQKTQVVQIHKTAQDAAEFRADSAAQPRVLFHGVPIKDVYCLALHPGDTVVLKVDSRLSDTAAYSLRKALQSEFPGHKVLVLQAGMDIGVLSPEAFPEEKK